MGGAELSYWLVLRRCPGIGPRRFAALLAKENSLSNYFFQDQPRKDLVDWCRHQGIQSVVLDWKGVEKDLAWADGANRSILTWQDEAYPEQLKEIASPPPLLFVEGQYAALKNQQIGIVGSRRPTAQGRENAYYFGFELAAKGFTITSGLALGIDGASHEGTLQAQGSGIAVLGNGFPKIYPARHQKLAEDLQIKGAVISEFPTGTPPKAEHFPQRNRIISGLSRGVLVIESAIKSGSLITAKYAIEQDREVFAVPGSIHNPLAKGCHFLIRQGAKCVDSIDHILEEFCSTQRSSIDEHRLPVNQSRQEQPDLFCLSEVQSQLLEHIAENQPTPIDVMVIKTGLTIETVSSILLEMELQGWVTSVSGGYIRLASVLVNNERKCN